MKIRIHLLLSTLMLLMSTASCTYTVPIEPDLPPVPEDISFVEEVEPIFTIQKCTDCHKSSSSAGKLDLTVGNSYASIMANSYAIAGEPENSSIYTTPINTGNHMAKYTAEQGVIVYGWIEQGAKDN